MESFGSSFRIRGVVNGNGTLTFDWGDGDTSTFTRSSGSANPDETHTFKNGSGYHTIRVKIEGFNYYTPDFNQFNDSAKQVISVGPPPNGNKFRPGFQCNNVLTIDGTYDLSASNGLNYAFRNCYKLKSIP